MIIPDTGPSIGFLCSEIVGGWSWTLTTRLGQLLHEAENRYGPRDQSYTVLGIEFGGEIPCLWYPGNRKQISIKLSRSAAAEPRQAYFQLAHEVIHLLAPGGSGGANILEEGLATIFCDEMGSLLGGYFTSDPRYLFAKMLVSQLALKRPSGIKDLRRIEPCFSEWTPELLAEIGSDLSTDQLCILCRPFASLKAGG